MGERINIQNLIDLLAEKKGLSKKEAERFLKEMFGLIEEALEKEQYLKIKGFGTFKLIAVDSRESVNVNTGERIEIQGHTKISFTPEASLRDQINKPFAHFETIILNEGTVFDDLSQTDDVPDSSDDSLSVNEEEQTELQDLKVDEEIQIKEEDQKNEEIEQIKDDTEFIPQVEMEVQEIAAPEIQNDQSVSVSEEFVVSEVETKVEEALIDTQEYVAKNVEPIAEESKVEEEEEKEKQNVKDDVIEKKSLLIEDLILEAKAENEVSKNYGRDYSLAYLIVVVVFVLVFLAGVFTYIYSPDFVMNILSGPQQSEQQFGVAAVKSDSINTVAKQRKDSLVLIKAEEDKIKNDTTTTMISGLAEVNASLQPDSTRYKIVGTMETYTVKAGDGLMKISKHFYESKNLWPYIVKFNPKIRKSPNSIAQGTVLFIPALRDKK